MGCGKSKHAIATESTIGQSKRSNSKKINEEKATNDVQSFPQEENGNVIPEPHNGTENAVEEEKGENLKAGNVTESDRLNDESLADKVKDGEKKEAIVAVNDAKETGEKKELKEEEEATGERKIEAKNDNDQVGEGEAVHSAETSAKDSKC